MRQIFCRTGRAVNASELLELLTGANDSGTFAAGGLLTRRLAHHVSFALSLFLVALRVGHSLVDQIGDEHGTQSKKAEGGRLFIILEGFRDSLHFVFVLLRIVFSDLVGKRR